MGTYRSPRQGDLHPALAAGEMTGGRGPGGAGRSGDNMNVLVRTPDGVEEVREVEDDWVIPGDVLDDGSIVLELRDELSDDDYLAIGLYD